MGTSGQIRVMESREKWKVVTSFWRKVRQRVCAQVYDVGRHFLVILRQQGHVGVHGERSCRRTAGPGHGAQARIAVVDEYIKRGGRCIAEGGI